MAPVVLTTQVFQPNPSQFQRDRPDVSGESPSQPVNGIRGLRQDIIIRPALAQCASKRTLPSTKAPCENLDLSSSKKRKLLTVKEASDWSVRINRSNSVLRIGRNEQHNDGGKTACWELPSVTVTRLNATYGHGQSIQSPVTHDRDIDRHQKVDVSESTQCCGVETSVPYSPERRRTKGQESCISEPGNGPSRIVNGGESLQLANNRQRTDPAEGAVVDPQIQVTADESQSLKRQYDPSGRSHNQQGPSSSGTQNFDFKAIARNFCNNDRISKDTNEHSGNEVAPDQVPASPEIPTVVQEFARIMNSKRKRRAPRRIMQHKETAEVPKKRACLDAVGPGVQLLHTYYAQSAGGRVIINSTRSSDIEPRASQPYQDQRSGSTSISPNIQETDSQCKATAKPPVIPLDESAAEYLCLNPTIPAEGPKSLQDLDAIRYSVAYLRSLTPYCDTGFTYPNLKFKCVFCSQLFSSHIDYQAHLNQRHCGDDPYECPFCFERFNHSLTYSGHLNEHIRQYDYPMYPCQACSASFSSKWEYDIHGVMSH